MPNTQIYRARIAVDLLYEASKPLTPPDLTMIASRTGTYLRTGAVVDLDKKIKVLFNEEYRNQHAHHHDARFDTCRPDYRAARDGLGPIEDEGLMSA